MHIKTPSNFLCNIALGKYIFNRVLGGLLHPERTFLIDLNIPLYVMFYTYKLHNTNAYEMQYNEESLKATDVFAWILEHLQIL